MAQLLVRNISEDLALRLKRRAAEHGVSAEEEHRRILQESLGAIAAKGEGKRSLFDHIRQLGEIAPDFEFEADRSEWERRDVEL
jgi:plasmid stability protein